MSRETHRSGMSYSDAGRLGAEKTKAFMAKVHADYVQRYLQNPRHCKCCGSIIPYGQRTNIFCSKSCSAKFNNAKRIVIPKIKPPKKPKRNPTIEIKEKEVILCEVCGNPIEGHGKRFCSLECSSKFSKMRKASKLNSYIMETGEFPKGSGITNSGEVNRRQVRKYLEEKFGHRCSICGNTEWMGKPIPLVVDHIDGNPLNCKVDNFRLVCGNCDMQLDTYKGKNKGNGRAWRKKYSI